MPVSFRRLNCHHVTCPGGFLHLLGHVDILPRRSATRAGLSRSSEAKATAQQYRVSELVLPSISVSWNTHQFKSKSSCIITQVVSPCCNPQIQPAVPQADKPDHRTNQLDHRTNQLDHRGHAVPLMGQRKAAKPKAGQHQDTVAQLPPLQQPAAAMDTAGAPPAPAAAAGMPAPPDVTLGTLQQLEEKKKRLGHQLKDVERQVRRGLVVWDT